MEVHSLFREPSFCAALPDAYFFPLHCLCVAAVEEGEPFLTGHVPGKPHEHTCKELCLATNGIGSTIGKEAEAVSGSASADRMISQTLPVVFGIGV